ncbi:MAG: acyltransferase family protein [Oscillospiraceae bacterium]|nr:acyltransferase family protein [Oscillospiraceae bacterium]
MTEKKNNAVEFFRFFFCAVLFLLHFRGHGHYYNEGGHFSAGYLGVEFFFITAGFFLMRHVVREECAEPCSCHVPAAPQAAPGESGCSAAEAAEQSAGRAALRYLRDRYRRLYPMYLLSLLFLIPVRMALEPDFSLKTALTAGLPDLLAVQIFFRPYELNLFLWYVSALIWASVPVYWLLKKNRKLFLYGVEPAVLLGFAAFTWLRFGHVDLTEPEQLWISGFRAFAEIGLGCWVYLWYDRLSRSMSRGAGRRASATAAEVLLLAGILLIMYRTRRSAWDYAAIALLTGFTLLVFLRWGVMSEALDNRLSGFLGSLSYAMYLNQFAVTELTESLLPGLGYWSSAAWRLALLALVSWLEILAVDRLRRGRQPAQITGGRWNGTA